MHNLLSGRTVWAWYADFAKYQSATDPRTEIPPEELFVYRYHRKPPYIHNYIFVIIQERRSNFAKI